MTRPPLLATALVAIAVAAMVTLGFWQISRLHAKEALLARYAANARLPEIAYPRFQVGDDLLFRRAAGFCLRAESWHQESGRDRAGNSGWRQIAHCSTGAEGPGITVQLGIARDSSWPQRWGGGEVHGYISHAPSGRPAILSLFGGGRAPELMLVADTPPPGLAANAAADLSAVPNNHLAYAVQWFLFAGIALVIYALALRGRGAKARPPVAPGGAGR